MIRFLIVFALAIAIGVAWYVGARSVALWTEAFDTQTLGSKDIPQIGWNGTYLLVDSQILCHAFAVLACSFADRHVSNGGI